MVCQLYLLHKKNRLELIDSVLLVRSVIFYCRVQPTGGFDVLVTAPRLDLLRRLALTTDTWQTYIM